LGPGFRVGPGSYQPQHGENARRKRVDTGVPKIRKLTVEQGTNNEYMYVGDSLVPSYFSNNNTKKHSVIQMKNVDYIMSRKTPVMNRRVLIASRVAENTPPLIENNISQDEIRIRDESVRNSYLLNYEP
jgi:hypothetical protein